MKILSFNVRQWTRDIDSKSPYYWKKRMEAMNKMIGDIQPDIICFQEMLIPAECYIPKDYKRIGITASHPIYVKNKIKYSSHKFQIHQECVTINKEIQIINVHSHWEDKILETNLHNIEKMMTNLPIVICGDFNNDLEKIERFGGIKDTVSARKFLGITEKEYTFEHFTNQEHKFTIDHFFIKGIVPISYKLIKDNYGVERISDHYPILLEF